MTDAGKSHPDAGHTPQARTPRTQRGMRTYRALLDAAAQEFGANGFHATGIQDITRRAGVALGSFYTWFDSKEEIFRALVLDLSAQVKNTVAPAIASAADALTREHAALDAFLNLVSEQSLIYRIVDEAEFVAPDSYRLHYETTADRVRARLSAGAETGDLRPDLGEIEAWAIIGMNVFLGLRYGVWEQNADLAEVAQQANRLLAEGIRAKEAQKEEPRG